MSLEITKFLEHLVASDKTSVAYAQTLRQFEEFLNGESPTEENAIEFLAEKTQSGCKGSTVMRYGFALRKYFRWKKVVVTIDLPKRKKQLLKWLTPEDLEALVETSAKQPLAQALIMLLYDSGMRIGEALSLVIGDIDEDGLILIRETKTGEERKVPISQKTLEVVKSYLSKRGLTSKKTKVFNINYQLSRKIIAFWGRKIGIDWLHPHALRHSRGVHLRLKGTALEDIADLLGHSNLNTTRDYYAGITPEELKKKIIPGF